MRKANEAGVYVVLVDSGVEGSDDCGTIVQTDNVAAAEAGAHYAPSLIGEVGRVAMLEGEPGGETAANRTKGFHTGIEA